MRFISCAAQGTLVSLMDSGYGGRRAPQAVSIASAPRHWLSRRAEQDSLDRRPGGSCNDRSLTSGNGSECEPRVRRNVSSQPPGRARKYFYNSCTGKYFSRFFGRVLGTRAARISEGKVLRGKGLRRSRRIDFTARTEASCGAQNILRSRRGSRRIYICVRMCCHCGHLVHSTEYLVFSARRSHAEAPSTQRNHESHEWK